MVCKWNWSTGCYFLAMYRSSTSYHCRTISQKVSLLQLEVQLTQQHNWKRSKCLAFGKSTSSTKILTSVQCLVCSDFVIALSRVFNISRALPSSPKRGLPLLITLPPCLWVISSYLVNHLLFTQTWCNLNSKGVPRQAHFQLPREVNIENQTSGIPSDHGGTGPSAESPGEALQDLHRWSCRGLPCQLLGGSQRHRERPIGSPPDETPVRRLRRQQLGGHGGGGAEWDQTDGSNRTAWLLFR